jgi:tRNA nucleotidyltransferase (CCA-adding enzyme)
MDLVGDLSSARLRDELIALLEEERADFSLRRMEELGLTPSIHGRLRADQSTRELIRRSDGLRATHRLGAEVPRWRLRLIWMLRDLEPEEIALWTERMRIKRQDADVLERGFVLGERLARRVSRGPAEAELYDLATGEPLEAVVAAMTLDESGVAGARLGRYLDVTRHVRLEISGEDLLALGIPTSPQIGEVLRSVLHLKLNGVVHGRDQELRAAERLHP